MCNAYKGGGREGGWLTPKLKELKFVKNAAERYRTNILY